MFDVYRSFNADFLKPETGETGGEKDYGSEKLPKSQWISRWAF